MTGYVLLDTDVFSWVWQGHANAEPFREAMKTGRPCISFATVAEVFKGAAKRGWAGRRVEQLEARLQATLVVPYDVEAAKICGRVLAAREAQGRSMEEFDAWIAATALRHGIPLATGNRRHFDGIPDLLLVGS